jgi:hypothetical protein
MTLDDDDADWSEVVQLMRDNLEKSRGYSSYWEWALDPSRVEMQAADVLTNFLAQKGELMTRTISLYRPDPPDVLLTTKDGSHVGIEVTELVSEEAIKRYLRAQRMGMAIPYDWAEWTPDSIAIALSQRVIKKDSKLKKANGQFSQLLLAIITDEPIIDEAIANKAIMLWPPLLVEHLDRAFLILSYQPQAEERQFPDGCPVLEIPLRRP